MAYFRNPDEGVHILPVQNQSNCICESNLTALKQRYPHVSKDALNSYTSVWDGGISENMPGVI